MIIGKKIGKYFSEKDFNLLLVSLFRADGKLETPTISKKDNCFVFRNQLFEKGKRTLKREIQLSTDKLKECVISIFEDLEKKECKRICLSQANGIIFMDLYER